MDVVRRVSLLVTAGLLGIAVMLGGLMSRPAVSANVAKELNAATSFFDSTIVLARGARRRALAAINSRSRSAISSACDSDLEVHFGSSTKQWWIRA